ncbi:hypothetical protein IE077_002968 [Cardiosporidium cionae]|uniref:Uncharacterized protein n=1 Tax=Cardiosporidium cionae TaxID=476202 RepID=A0ABQ7J9L7_9APIC|nr:hypothetical protein IE077_002968 [Cardiosporidium cionae]|eukprot:KAF8820651.1 hypothetical protein IE077_002968 [Cardiosporidium cionae]
MKLPYANYKEYVVVNANESPSISQKKDQKVHFDEMLQSLCDAARAFRPLPTSITSLDALLLGLCLCSGNYGLASREMEQLAYHSEKVIRIQLREIEKIKFYELLESISAKEQYNLWEGLEHCFFSTQHALGINKIEELAKECIPACQKFALLQISKLYCKLSFDQLKAKMRLSSEEYLLELLLLLKDSVNIEVDLQTKSISFLHHIEKGINDPSQWIKKIRADTKLLNMLLDECFQYSHKCDGN